MNEIVLVDNKDITIKALMIGSTVLQQSIMPSLSISEWTPAYEKRCDHWKQVAKRREAKIVAKH